MGQQTVARNLPVPARDLIITLGVFFVSLAVFLPFAPLDPDPQHDGFHYAVALAIADGWRIHADVFSGYGPTAAIAQGILLEVFPQTLITLRVFNAVLLAGVAASAYAISRLLHVRRLSSILLSLTWVLLSPAWGVFADALPLWPWPSVFFTFFAQLSVLLLLVALRGPNANALLFSASAFAVLTVTIRANQGIPFVFSLLLAFFVTPKGRHLAKRHKWAVITGGMLPALLLLSYLLIIGAVRPAIHDTLIGPISVYLVNDLDPTARVTAPIDVRAFLVEGFLLASLPVLIITFGILLVLRRRPWGTQGLIALMAMATVAGLTVASIGYYGRPRSIFETFAGETLSLTTLNVLGVAPLYAAAVGIVVALIFWIWTGLAGRQWPLPLAETTVLFASLAFTTQLVPRWDVYHLWWAGPLMLITCFYFITRNLSGQQQVVMACAITLPYGMLATYSWYNTLLVDRVSISEGSLQGMRVLPGRQSIVSDVSTALAEIPERSAQFLCDDGLISAMNGVFLSDRTNFVQVGWSRQPAPSRDPSFIVTCVDSEQDLRDSESRIPASFQLIEGPLRMDLSPWSQTELRIYRNYSVS